MESGVRKPEFITFTGADRGELVPDMVALSRDYPIEWGILFSPARQGQARYPEPEMAGALVRMGLRMAVHLCGGHSRRVMSGKIPLVRWVLAAERVQVNSREPVSYRICELSEFLKVRCIAQARGTHFPEDDSISWLFDRSGGRGELPAAWPPHPGGDRLVGYAGGLGPENVRQALRAIDATGPYWIDMESGVRTDDRFDLAKCRAVCEAVYGA